MRGLQERAARALPAGLVKDVGGWWLRHATGCSWWVGSVLPHAEADGDELVRRVAEAEDFYAGHGAVARFQISPGACPAELDTLLAERGYRRESLISLQVAATARVAEGAPGGAAGASGGALRVCVDDRPTRAWFDVWQAVQGHDDGCRDEWEMLARVDQPSAYARVMSGDDVIAVGRAVADTGWAGVFGMATLLHARGKGAARAVLAALAEWAAAHRAGHMYLQVVRGNIPALRLYERLGFREVCGYHYRVAV